MKIAHADIGPNAPCFIIAEVAQAHEGSLGMAHAFIDAAAKTGVDAVKFQTHIADAETTKHEPFRVQFSQQDATRMDYWRRMEFTPDQWAGLAQHAAEAGLVFLSSPFSNQAVDLLESLAMPAYKIASGEVSNEPMLAHIAKTGKPILFSSGMSGWAELDRSIAYVRGFGAQVGVFQCTSMYPTPPEKVGLNVIPLLRERYDCPVGLSDHSGTIFAGLAAAAHAQIDLLEVHLTLSREMFGPDVVASVTTDELTQLVQGVRFIEAALAGTVDKDAVQDDMQPLRDIFLKSAVLTQDLPADTTLSAAHLAAKKPGSGIPARQIPSLVGRVLARDVEKDRPLTEDDLA